MGIVRQPWKLRQVFREIYTPIHHLSSHENPQSRQTFRGLDGLRIPSVNKPSQASVFFCKKLGFTTFKFVLSHFGYFFLNKLNMKSPIQRHRIGFN